jgi:type I restriction enzyme S subunit
MTERPLRRLFGSVDGGSWGGEPGADDVDLPCVRGTDLDFPRLRVDLSRAPVRSYSLHDVRRRAATSGDLIIEKSGGGEKQPVGRAVFYGGAEAAMPTNFAGRLRPLPDVDPRFATYLLAASYFAGRTASAIKQSTGIQNLDLEELLRQRVFCPDLSSQRVIADALDNLVAQIDGLIATKLRMCDLLSERWTAVVESGVSGRLERTPCRQSTIPWVEARPQHWMDARLKYVARLGTGHTPSRSHPEWWVDCTIPWVTTGEVSQMRSDRLEVLNETREKISKLGVEKSGSPD